MRDDLPSDSRTYLAPEAPATGQIFWYTVEGPGLDLGQLRAIQDFYVKAQLATVEGVAEVASVGGFVREYQIEVDPWKLAAHRSTLGAVLDALAKAQATVGGSVVQRAGQEFVVRVPGWFGVDEEGLFSEQRAVDDLRHVVIPATDGTSHLLGELASIGLGPGPRRGALEKDGNEVTGGVVMMRYGENPRQVTERLLRKISLLSGGLPPGVRIVPGYDRTALIDAAVGTVTRSLVEAVITSVVCVLVILLHVRSSFVIAVTLPLATLATFALLHLLRSLGLAQIPTNIMSLSGIAISIGVLVDSSIVVTENIMHRLRLEWGDRPVTGDTRPVVMEACRTVVRPIFFSILIMLVSFLPVLTMGGSAGKMFRPLALTKIIALGWVALLAMTLVPVLASYLVRGRLRREEDSWIVRSLIDVYRPLLQFLLDRPAAMFWMMTVTVMLGVAPLGIPWLFRAVLLCGAVVCGCTATRRWTQLAAVSSILFVGLLASGLRPIEHETNFITPLDEGTVMDMPITIPRIGLSQALDDMKARDMIICRFPEVEMVMGKVGRAETPTDPAPVDMIETMVSLRPRDYWPRRKLPPQEARKILDMIWSAAVKSEAIAPLSTAEQATRLDAIQAELLPRFDAQMREFSYHRQQEFLEELRRLTLTDVIAALVDVVPSHRFRKRPTAAELPVIVSAVSLSLIPHHGSAPSEMEIEEIVNQAAWEMQERGWIAGIDELLHPELHWWERSSQFTW
ncbi:MAG: efflux RND transporter permease subunit, partial [Planctomycetota bacterium]